MQWTQPLCAPCWRSENPDRDPVRVRNDDLMTCCMCGGATGAGIYVRRDPRTVPYPRTEED